MINSDKMVLDPRIGNALLEAYVRLSAVRDLEDGEMTGYRVAEMNEQAAHLFGLRPEQAVGQNICEILALDQNCWRALRQRLLDVEGAGPFDYQFKRSNRRYLISPVQLGEDEVLLFFTEITYRRQAEEALRVHEILFNGAHDIILYIDMTGQVVDANRRALEAYGYTKEQILSLNIYDIRDPSTSDVFEEQMQRADANGVVFECVHRRADGSVFPVEVSARSTETSSGRLRIHIIRDITERKEHETKIAWLTRHDELTGALNRVNFIAELEEEILRARRNKTQVALLLFDIDKFKFVNDCYGHVAGDLVLKTVVQRVQSVLRVSDRIGRLGGDEFLILQADVKSSDDVLSLVSRITQILAEPIAYEKYNISITTSIGVSLFPTNAQSSGDLILFADKAMYEAKRSGGNDFFLYGSTTR